jgi:hypothetical protein
MRSVQNSWCSVREAGFGRIKSVRLLFNYRGNFLGSNPGTLTRNYLVPSLVYEVPQEKIEEQIRVLDTETKCRTYNLAEVSFQGIDCRAWQSGMWDMWIETEDDLGNFGLAPFAQTLVPAKGYLPVRQIEKK